MDKLYLNLIGGFRLIKSNRLHHISNPTLLNIEKLNEFANYLVPINSFLLTYNWKDLYFYFKKPTSSATSYNIFTKFKIRAEFAIKNLPFFAIRFPNFQ